MNRKEYYSRKRYSKELHILYKKIKQWKLDNGITECCVIHHRDDTPETIEYNEKYYERWGFNEDGTFEYGKYVVFMTNADHTSYHRKGKSLSTETREKLSAINKGKVLSDETKAKISRNSARYWKGKQKPPISEETREKLRQNNARYWKGKHRAPFSDECRAKMSAARKANLVGLRLLYNVYKNNNGAKKWNDFQKSIYNGDITFEERPISVFL